MSRLCHDTSPYSHFCRGHAAAVDTVSEGGPSRGMRAAALRQEGKHLPTNDAFAEHFRTIARVGVLILIPD